MAKCFGQTAFLRKTGSLGPEEYCHNLVGIYKENDDNLYSIQLCTHSYIKYTIQSHILYSEETVVYGVVLPSAHSL